jgi:hypothetical protein
MTAGRTHGVTLFQGDFFAVIPAKGDFAEGKQTHQPHTTKEGGSAPAGSGDRTRRTARPLCDEKKNVHIIPQRRFTAWQGKYCNHGGGESLIGIISFSDCRQSSAVFILAGHKLLRNALITEQSS